MNVRGSNGRWVAGDHAVAALAIGEATGAAGPCVSVRLVEAAGLSADWRESVRALRDDLQRLDPAACVGATVIVGPSGAGASVLVTTADGRQAERAVVSPRALEAVTIGLLATAPPDAAPQPVAGPESREVAPRPAPAAVSMRAGGPPPPPAIAFRVGASAGGRFGFPTPVGMGDLTARVELRVHEWLVVTSGRFGAIAEKQSGARIPGWSYQEVGLGLGVGRRLHVGELPLELAIVPELVTVDEEGDVPTTGAGGRSEEFRVQAGARAVVPVPISVRPALAVDTEFAPLSLAHANRVAPELPPLPTWTLGVSAGVLWEVP